MDESEIWVFLVSAVAAVAGGATHRLDRLHTLFFDGNPAPGIARLGTLLGMGWIVYVLRNHADPSVTGVYVVMYLVMGYAAVKVLGQSVPAAFGARLRVDVVERRNVPAAVFLAAFTMSTALIFGGSLWGEADPVGDDEGGWWIPVSFFLLGWGCLVVALHLFLRREKGRFAHRLQRERSLEDVRPVAFFLLAAAVTLTDAVAGDFWGWRHGLTTFGVLAGLLVVHELFAGLASGHPGDTAGPRRLLESALYALLGLTAWALNRYLDSTLASG